MRSTLIIAMVLAAALTSTSALPAFAAKNDGSFQQSSEGNKPTYCGLYEEYYKYNLERLRAAKTKEAKATARANVNWAIGTGFANGCAWVAGV